MKNKLKIMLGAIMTLGFAIRPINCTATQTICLVVVAMFGSVMALDGLTKEV